jgi:pilus assembly protein TadC
MVHILVLLFIAPFVTFAIYLLLDETRDPFQFFDAGMGMPPSGTDSSKSTSSISSSNETVSAEERNKLTREKSSGQRRDRIVLLLLVLLFLLLLFSKGSGLGIFALSIGSASWWMWRRGAATRRQRAELRSVESEFPQVVELFSILVNAGLSPALALERISERTHGELSSLLRTAIAQMHSGKNFTMVLENLGNQSTSHSIRRFCDNLIIAVSRGTSLSEVLNRQVAEVRSNQRAELIESAGKAEIALMIPVVFLILPISVLFALWPSYLSLGSGHF